MAEVVKCSSCGTYRTLDQLEPCPDCGVMVCGIRPCKGQCLCDLLITECECDEDECEQCILDTGNGKKPLDGFTFVKDENGRYVSFDAGFLARYKDYSPRIGMRDRDFLCDSLADLFETTDRLALAKGCAIEMMNTIHTPNGTQELLVRKNVIEIDGKRFISGRVVNITDHVKRGIATAAMLAVLVLPVRALMHQGMRTIPRRSAQLSLTA